MTWKELKEFVNNLDEKNLEEKVTLWGDGISTGLKADILKEDYFLLLDGEVYPGTDLENVSSEQDDEIALVWKSGEPIFFEVLNNGTKGR